MKSIKHAIATAVAEHTGFPAADIVNLIEYPPNPELGDLALPCFQFAKQLRKNPALIASELADKLAGIDGIGNANAQGGYLNLTLERSTYALSIVDRALQSVHDLFSEERGTGHTVAVDYSAPNIAKPFGVGHLRSTIIGQAIVRLMREDGYRVEGVNHLGDWGTQFGKNIAAYLKWGDEETVRKNPVRELFKLYVRFHEEAREHPELEDEGRYWFKQLEEGHEQANRLWRWFIDESLRAFQETYKTLGVEFDHYLGESFYNDKMDAIVDELRAKGLLVEDDGAEVVDLSAYDMPPCIIKKSDGTSIYATRDLAAADYRHRVLGADTLVYVVGAEQKLHFQQVFKVLELLGRDYAKRCTHVAFGLMKFNGERLSTRRGHVVYLEDVLNKAIEEAKRIIQEKNPNLADQDGVARSVGVGAVIFNDLKTYRIHEVDFRYEDVLNFDGETGPYVQYTHARACSVLRKAGTDAQPLNWPTQVQPDDVEWALILRLAQAGEALARAVDEFDPSVMARYVLHVCHAFNRFYHNNPILQADDPLRAARLALTQATRNVIAKALYLIGLDAPQEM
ncbi:arginine--tRNA ligase [Alicyclobacillus hesperidum]|uniref:Arginine--tRNA ligase n=1 Tax=Alicyclobacillus hesperidum TaxID=89784 RepID=A0A1H2WDN6_9BACL|nr:arginine--tRNA ligase [Alicyclobacillus hesperidum]GLV14555.1 arginine--tRNA ligase [Alicyclobacillus hesperidum]SDW78149.1 arginyl-tRNA synthetase [Alicyclobacillus hesperidum]